MTYKEELNKDEAKELLTILSFCDEKFIDCIPKDVFRTITEIASESNVDYYVNPNIPLGEQKISDNCKKVLGYLYNTYVKK